MGLDNNEPVATNEEIKILRRIKAEREGKAAPLELQVEQLKFWLRRIDICYRDASGLPLHLQAYCMRSEAKVALGSARWTEWAVELADILGCVSNERAAHALAQLGRYAEIEDVPAGPTAVAERCPDCGHQSHPPGGCLNMASDNDCNCRTGAQSPAVPPRVVRCLLCHHRGWPERWPKDAEAPRFCSTCGCTCIFEQHEYRYDPRNEGCVYPINSCDFCNQPKDSVVHPPAAVDVVAEKDVGHPEDFCQLCGRSNVTWFAPSPLWNQAIRAKHLPEILCPVCFIEYAEAAGIKPTAWRVAPENLVATTPADPRDAVAIVTALNVKYMKEALDPRADLKNLIGVRGRAKSETANEILAALTAEREKEQE